MARPRDLNVESIFIGLRRAWHPPSAAIEASFTRLTRTLAGIYATLGSDPDLAQVHAEIYRDFPGLTSAPPAEPTDRRQVADRRAAGADTTVKSFYLCNSLIQLMEDVYLDLHLEQEYRHPDNRGWMNLFRHWAEADTFRKAWAVSAPTYGSRFQAFCSRRLGLTLGITDLVSLWDARYSEAGPLDDERATALEDAERRVIDILTRRYIRGDRNPIAERVRQVVLCRLRVPLGRAAKLQGLGRGILALEDRRDDLLVPYGIALISGDRQYAPDIDRERSTTRDDGGRLLTLRVRRHLRDQGLGRQLMQDLVRRLGVRRTASPKPAEMRVLGLAPGAGEQIDSMFKSVLNEIALGEQRTHRLVGNPVFGLVPRLPYSGVVRPREATWAHAVGFIYWILAWTDGDTDDVEVEAVLRALRVWAGRHVEREEIAFAVRESRAWYLTAKRPVTALWPEVRAIVGELKKQRWFDQERRGHFRTGLEQIAFADAERSKDEAELIAAIEAWMLPEKKEKAEGESSEPGQLEDETGTEENG